MQIMQKQPTLIQCSTLYIPPSLKIKSIPQTSYLDARVAQRKLLKPKTKINHEIVNNLIQLKAKTNCSIVILIHQEVLTALNSEAAALPLSTEALGDEPSSEPS